MVWRRHLPLPGACQGRCRLHSPGDHQQFLWECQCMFHWSKFSKNIYHIKNEFFFLFTCPCSGSTPDHIAPSLIALKPHSPNCLCLSGSSIFGSYQGKYLITELMPLKSLIRPSRSTNCPSFTYIWDRSLGEKTFLSQWWMVFLLKLEVLPAG